MPYELNEIAAISGMPGLYRLLKAARHGVLVETLAEPAVRSMAPARNKVSLLSEISIYTNDYDTTVPLTEAFERIYQQHGTDLAVTSKSSEAELTDFMAAVIPDYDRDRVYLSDIKKLATWYGIVSKHLPYKEAATSEATTEAASDEPAATEPLSTGGVIAEPEAAVTATATDNPEAGAAKKSRKKAE